MAVAPLGTGVMHSSVKEQGDGRVLSSCSRQSCLVCVYLSSPTLGSPTPKMLLQGSALHLPQLYTALQLLYTLAKA